MKRKLVIVAGLATLTAAALIGTRLRAQAPAPTGVQPPAQTRVAFINLEYVFQNYEKAKTFKKEMDLIIDDAGNQR